MASLHLATRLWGSFQLWVVTLRGILTRELNYSTDLFFGLDFFMAAAGVRLKSQNGTLRRCWNVYRWIIHLPGIVICWNAIVFVKRHEQLEVVLITLEATMTIVVTVMRMFLLRWNYKSFVEVKNYVNRCCFGRNLGPSLGVRSRAFDHVRKIVTGVIILIFFLVATVVHVGVAQHPHLKLPFDVRSTMPYVQDLCEKMLGFLTFGVISLMSLVYLIDYIVLTGLAAECKVIAQTFAAIFTTVEQRIQRKMDSEPVHRQNVNRKYYFWMYVQEELGKCITLHIEFLAKKNKIKPLLNANFLIIYYSTVVILASGVAHMSKMKTVTLYSLQILGHVLYVAFECATLTRMVNLMTEAVGVGPETRSP